MSAEDYIPLPERERKSLLKADFKFLWDEVEKRGGANGYDEDRKIDATSAYNLAVAIIGRQGSKTWIEPGFIPEEWYWTGATNIPTVEDWDTDASAFEAGGQIRLQPMLDMFSDIYAMSTYLAILPSYSPVGWTYTGADVGALMWYESSSYGTADVSTALSSGRVRIEQAGANGWCDVFADIRWTKASDLSSGITVRTFHVNFTDGVGYIEYQDLISTVNDIRSHFDIGNCPEATLPGQSYSQWISFYGIQFAHVKVWRPFYKQKHLL